eukprot:TRINITY_DN3846_c0_g1_i4.p1 TRINITY_DN3846_c0_g1~~TRINITY_DN3846_c0_g1_i4.p1  ORF type:complete len:145 (+),score=12.59 TRINITY_DN3846_c0_g1_i4:172-606(+)
MKGTGIWLDLGRTLSFEQHFQAFSYLLPDYIFTNTNNDLIALENAMRKQKYDTIQFLANNEDSLFIYEILDARYKDELVSCPSTTKFISQYASNLQVWLCQYEQNWYQFIKQIIKQILDLNNQKYTIKANQLNNVFFYKHKLLI